MNKTLGSRRIYFGAGAPFPITPNPIVTYL